MTAIVLIGVPRWASALLLGAWAVGVALLSPSVRRAPVAAVLVPLANALILWATIAAGDAL